MSAVSNALYIESPLVIGLAVQLCWLFFLAYQAFHCYELAGVISRAQYVCWCVSFPLAFAVASLAVGFNREKITHYIRRKSVHLLIGVGSSAGTLCACSILIVATGEFQAVAAAFVGSVVASILCAPLTLLWGEAARRRSQATLAVTTVASILLALVLIFALLLAIDSNPVTATAIACLCPIVSVVFVYKAQHDNESYFKPQEFVVLPDGTQRAKEGRAWVETFHDLRISKGSFALKLGRSAFLFGLVYGVLFAECFQSLLLTQSILQTFPFSAIPALLAVSVFTVLFFWPLRAEDYARTSQRLLPFFAVFLLLAYGAGDGPRVALLALFSMMVWFYPAELTARYRISSMITFGFFLAFFALGLLVAFLAVVFLPLDALPPVAVLAVCLALFVLGCAFLVADDQIREVAIRDARQLGRSQAASAKGAEPPRATFRQRCQVVADTFLLSHRELEILCLLAKGRNAAYVQEKLVISEGTVRTHMRNIYRKLDVHSQQELMDLVDAVDC